MSLRSIETEIKLLPSVILIEASKDNTESINPIHQAGKKYIY